jgi:hypothetical protein
VTAHDLLIHSLMTRMRASTSTSMSWTKTSGMKGLLSCDAKPCCSGTGHRAQVTIMRPRRPGR